MDNDILNIETETFTKISEMNETKKQLKEKICEHFGLKREDFKLQNGMIILCGLNENNVWCRITTKLTEVPKYMKKDLWKNFKFTTNLTIKK